MHAKEYTIEVTSHVNTLILEGQISKASIVKILLLMPSSQWYFIMVTLEL